MKISPLVIGAMRLGTWGAGFTTSQYEAFIKGCLDHGLNTFDHADIYGDYTTEEEFGAALRHNPNLRSKIKLVTKCGIKLLSAGRPEHQIKSYDFGKAHIISSVEKSLVNFNTDYIDMLLLHRPDYLMQAEEVADAFHQLEKAGKVLKFGVSNFTTSQLALLHKYYPLAAHQMEVSLVCRDAFSNGSLDQCSLLALQPMAWSPLGGGLLFREKSENRVINEVRSVALALSQKYDCQLDHILYAWIYRHPANILPVTGTSNISRVVIAKEALEIQMEREDWYKLWTAASGEELP